MGNLTKICMNDALAQQFHYGIMKENMIFIIYHRMKK